MEFLYKHTIILLLFFPIATHTMENQIFFRSISPLQEELISGVLEEQLTDFDPTEHTSFQQQTTPQHVIVFNYNNLVDYYRIQLTIKGLRAVKSGFSDYADYRNESYEESGCSKINTNTEENFKTPKIDKHVFKHLTHIL